MGTIVLHLLKLLLQNVNVHAPYYRTHTLMVGVGEEWQRQRGSERESARRRERERERDYILYIGHSQSCLPLLKSVEPWDTTPTALLKMTEQAQSGEEATCFTNVLFWFHKTHPFLVVWVLLTASFSHKHYLLMQFQHAFCINRNQKFPVFHVLLC